MLLVSPIICSVLVPLGKCVILILLSHFHGWKNREIIRTLHCWNILELTQNPASFREFDLDSKKSCVCSIGTEQPCSSCASPPAPLQVVLPLWLQQECPRSRQGCPGPSHQPHLSFTPDTCREGRCAGEGFLLSASCPGLCVALSCILWSWQGSEEEEDGVVTPSEQLQLLKPHNGLLLSGCPFSAFCCRKFRLWSEFAAFLALAYPCFVDGKMIATKAEDFPSRKAG